MKQVNFSNSGGFPLEQETLERLQKAYRSELFGALKSHLSIEKNTNYIVVHATTEAQGWAIITQNETDEAGDPQGILYPIKKAKNTGYLKTSRKGTNLIYGTGTSQTAYFDYDAAYINQSEFNNGVPQSSDASTENYYDLSTFKVVKDLKTIENILQTIKDDINVVEANINTAETNINLIKGDINLINQSYLPINGSKAMQGDLNLGNYQLSKLDIKEGNAANVRVADFKLGSIDRRGLLHPADPTGRALVDSSTQSATNLALNYAADWENTYIGGKVYLQNLNTSTNGSLLLLDNLNQVIKSDTLIDSLLSRITALENKPAATVPIGMVAIWGKTAPFPEGWEEYVPLRGRMPVGYNSIESEFNILNDTGGSKLSNVSAVVPVSGYVPTQNTSNGTPGKLIISTGYQEDSENLESIAIVSTSPSINFSVNNLNPYRVVHFIEYTGRLIDITPPTSPKNLQVSNISNTSVTLSWATATDDLAVKNYIVYGNGISPIVTGNVLSYTISGLSQDTSYNFYVKAQDSAQNLSIDSNSVNVRTTNLDSTIPTNFYGHLQSGNEMYLGWDAPASPGVVSYEIWRRQAGSTNSSHYSTSTTSTSYYPVTGLFDNTYFFKVRALYNTGNYSDFTDEAEITTEPRDIQCFDTESLVTMASGQSKKLKNIVIGDKLQGFSFPNEIDESDGDYMIWNGKLEEAIKAEVTVVNKITSIQPYYYEIKTADTTIKATGQHPLLVTEDGKNLQWICVKNVVPTMLLIDKTGKPIAIESITFKEESLEVALLDVENVDCYIISGIVAHNNKPLDPHDPQL